MAWYQCRPALRPMLEVRAITLHEQRRAAPCDSTPCRLCARGAPRPMMTHHRARTFDELLAGFFDEHRRARAPTAWRSLLDESIWAQASPSPYISRHDFASGRPPLQKVLFSLMPRSRAISRALTSHGSDGRGARAECLVARTPRGMTIILFAFCIILPRRWSRELYFLIPSYYAMHISLLCPPAAEVAASRRACHGDDA